MKHYRNIPSINAGSMADIAFLLLLFFLVSTTISQDKGIPRKLPPPCPIGQECEAKIKEHNIFRVQLNDEGNLLINQELVEISELRELLKGFIDNNGDISCSYCHGEQLSISSDNPEIATIAIQVNRKTPYNDFIRVQVEITAAYYELREIYAYKKFKTSLNALSSEQLQIVKAAYPFRISEADLK